MSRILLSSTHAQRRRFSTSDAGLGVIVGTAFTTVLVMALLSGHVYLGTFLPDRLLILGLTTLTLLVTWAVLALVIWLGRRISIPVLAMTLGGIATVCLIFALSGLTIGGIAALLIPVGSLLGASIGLFWGGWSDAYLPKKILLATFLGLMLLGSATLIGWLAYPGQDTHLTQINPWPAQPLDLPNPGVAGPYEVASLSYGLGSQMQTPRVDLTPFIGTLPAWRQNHRDRYWGFELHESPLNAQVWYPEGEGPFPLVLIVHGNHLMEVASHLGYAYLGELLASRGYIVASLDQNFLNISLPWGDFGGREIPARAILTLEHLALWREWNQTPHHPFYQKVDMEQVALIGHSRGGEAVAVAAALNQLQQYPDEATIPFAYGFGIRSVIAIAPTDSFYRPSGRELELENLNYLVLHGAHDGDVAIFLGNRQFNRVTFTEDHWFKSSLYIYQANHGQFNTAWGRVDLPPPFGWLLNTKPLLSTSEQEQLAKVLISAFLEATIAGDLEYVAAFRNLQQAADWLPQTPILHQYSDSTFRVISDFQEDIKVQTTTLPGGSIRGENLATWKEAPLPLRLSGNDQSTYGVYLGWNTDEHGLAHYSITLPPTPLRSGEMLILTVADPDPETPLSDFTIRLIGSSGEALTIPLSEAGWVSPALNIQYTKIGLLERRVLNPRELMLQTVEIPLGWAEGSELKEIHFVFDQTTEGTVVIGEIGLSQDLLVKSQGQVTLE